MSLYSLLLKGTPMIPNLLQDKLNMLLDPERSCFTFGGCILEIFELQLGTYLVVIQTITPLLISLYNNLFIDDARFIFKEAIYTVSIANKSKHRYLLPTPWKTKGPYKEYPSILYKANARLTYTCEYIEYEYPNSNK